MRIAWVGNSYVYFNDLPSMLAAMLAAQAGLTLENQQVTPGGERFSGHAANAAVAELLSKPFDHLVLQDNSAVPGGSDADALAASHAALTSFFAPRLAGRKVLIYGSWGHRRGCVYERHRHAYPDYPTMQARTSAGCEAYAKMLGDDARVVPVGAAFQRLYDLEVAAGRDPLDEASLFSRLFAPDDFHPSRLGSYLACCCFWAALTGTTPEGTAFRPAETCGHSNSMLRKHGSAWEPRAMSEEDAEKLQRAAAWACGLCVITKSAPP